MYYNPESTYTPWFGVPKNSNVPYGPASTTAAPVDPYDPSLGTVNLTTVLPDYITTWNGRDDWDNSPDWEDKIDGFRPSFYYVWDDLDNDNVVDPTPTDSAIRVDIVPATANYTDDGGFTDRSGRSDCAAAPTCTYAEEIQNFANWFVYYRKRELVLKRALSELIFNSSARMGLATLHDNNNIGTPVTDMTDPTVTSGETNRTRLMERLFKLNSNGGTPLRELLGDIGRYFNTANNTNSSMGSNFSSSTLSPILPLAEGGECQQNFNILMSDGFWNGGSRNFDNEDGDGDTDFDGGPHADNLSNTLADAAMFYYETDLSSLANLVPEVSVNNVVVDANTAQHLVTYTVAFGLVGTPGLTTPPDHDSATPPPSTPPWPTAIAADSKETLDDMQHSAFNGRGLFLNAQNPQDLISGLANAFADIDERIGQSGTAVAINSTVLRSSSRVFQATFNTVDWSGDLSAFTLTSVGEIDTKVWSATDPGKIPVHGDRNIFTTVTKGPPTNGPVGIAFTATDTDLVTAVGSTNIINYIRGDQSLEVQNGGTFRNRTILLGDIVSSSPISVAADNFFFANVGNPFSTSDPSPEGPAYTTYLTAKNSIFNPTVGDPFSIIYVGGNDGMLHAFRDTTNATLAGQEVFAYVPSTLHGALTDLTDPGYNHRFYVDAGPAVTDAFIDHDNNTSTPNEWRTILVGSLGSGGRTIYALDVSDPLNFSASDVMWEYTPANNNELGFVFSQPQIVRLNLETGNNTETARYGVIFGNGYNSANQRAQLIILDAQDGSEIAVLDTGVGDASNPNGLSMPFLLDEDGNRTVDLVYAGDLQGNLWKFDISATSAGNPPAAWKVQNFGTNANPEGLYQALDSGNTPQPITSRPVVVNHPDGGFMILFGTGKYLETGDPGNTDEQTFYGIRDKNTGSTSGANSDQVTAGRGDLVAQQILDDIDVFADLNTPPTPGDPSDDTVVSTARVISENTVDYTAKDGWYIDLLTPPPNAPIAEGERVIANPLTRFGRAIFITFIPPTSPCEEGGSAVLMEVDAINGGRLENSVFDLNDDGIIDAQDFVGYNSTQMPASGIFIPGTLASPSVLSADDASVEYKLTSGISGEVTTTKESTGGMTVGRQSWRQIR